MSEEKDLTEKSHRTRAKKLKLKLVKEKKSFQKYPYFTMVDMFFFNINSLQLVGPMVS